MGAIAIVNLGKAYKQYPTRWARLLEWLMLGKRKYHRTKWVLKHANLMIKAGESVGIMGVNGAGKSTLLKMITGTTQPTTGSIKISGRVVAMLELGMGFHPDFTGRQNVYMSGQLMGITSEHISRLMPEIESFAEIGEYIDQPVRIYSSGMQVRLAFSIATAVRPDVLIVDEALSVGDAYFQAKCYQRINKFKEEGTTLLLVSHSPGDVVKHCDRAILLKDGVVALDGSSRDVSNRYLDELFGKKTSGCDARARQIGDDLKSSPRCAIILDGEVDVFYSKPGYRKEEHRWGHGGAAILDYAIVSGGVQYPSSIEANAMVDFYFKVRFDAYFENVVPGLLIKTLEGIFLYGTNSFVSTGSLEFLKVEAGDFRVFRFSVPMALNEGHYLISFGISSGDPMRELVPLDRRYDSVLINVRRELQFWGLVDLGANFECIGENAEEVME